MTRHGNWAPECKVYIGDLRPGTTEREIEDPFSKFGTLRNVWVAQRPPGFAFVEFDDPRDAEDAVLHLDGVRINGARVRVEMSHGRSKRAGGGRRSPVRGGRYDDREGRRGSPGGRGGRRRSPSPRAKYDRFRSRSPRSRSRSRSPRRRSPSPP